jgi:aminobenzoyl-glutamate utilization protein B
MEEVKNNHFSMKAIGLVLLAAISTQAPAQISKTKKQAIEFIDSRKVQLMSWNTQVWTFAEAPLKEFRSARLIADVLKKDGFSIEENVAGFPTAFIATYGTIEPVIAFYGEYDADANASNKVVPHREELVKDGYGHGGHHNVLGIGSLAAALAVKDLIAKGKLKCTVKYFGTPDEGGVGARSYLARDGYFNNIDFSLYWHPSPTTAALPIKWDAAVDLEVSFFGKPANIAKENLQENTTVRAFESLLKQISELRQTADEGRRIGYSVKKWKYDISQLPDTITVGVRIQCAYQQHMVAMLNELTNEIDEIAKKGDIKVLTNITRYKHQYVPNVTSSRKVEQNMKLLPAVVYTNEEQEFARTIQANVKMKIIGISHKVDSMVDRSKRTSLYGYSSDIGDVSWFSPETYFCVKTLAVYQMHQWPGTAFSAHSIGEKGMIFAAKVLAMTAIDYVEDDAFRKAVRDEFEESTKGYQYKFPIQGIPLSVERH